MSRLKQIRMLALAIVGIAAAGASARAQEQEPPPLQEPPKPAARGIPGMDDSSEQQNVDQWQPDISPVTGLESPTLGTPALRHSYWVPGLQYSAMVQSNPYGANNSSGWYATHYLGGSLSLVKSWSDSILSLNYSGGGVITSQPGQSNGQYQQLAAAQSFQFRRWQLQWSDQFAYLPQTAFGFGAGTGLAAPGIGGSLGATTPGGLSPNESIFTAVGPRYSNTAVIQATYIMSARQSITVAGMDGVLHFTQAHNVDSQNYLGSFGYNYALTREDSIGLLYRFSSYHFPGQPQAYGDSSVGVAYQRKITRRLALQANVGPDFISYRVPLGGVSEHTSWQANASLTYGFARGSVSGSYYHGLSAGSGVLIGGTLDQFTLSGNRQITRAWSVNGNFGYARNRALNNAETVGLGSYDNYFFGGGVSRPIGRNMNFNAAYTAYLQQQAGSQGNTTEHTITIFFNWHTRPFVIE